MRAIQIDIYDIVTGWAIAPIVDDQDIVHIYADTVISAGINAIRAWDKNARPLPAHREVVALDITARCGGAPVEQYPAGNPPNDRSPTQRGVVKVLAQPVG